ncbi:MAG TPA: threonine synthase [Thermoanaerobaculia bacterium]|jgi:threonine synthase|nr:threonine synthase [Thermoanaerobaculia bacterium]
MRLVSTRDPQCHANFRQAVLAGIAPGGGLWMPDPLPSFPDWPELLDLAWSERCAVILDRLLANELGREPVARAVREALDFPVPLAPLAPAIPGVFALELFHGPTLAFKDFGARFFAAVLELVREPGRPVTILTATSGDTGAAVARAFWRRPGVRAVVLYPQGRVSALQELQFATLGENVTALAVDGAFDDCQTLVKAAFADAGLTARHGLTSANSINVARLLPQTLYYAEAVAALRRLGITDPPVISVPSGNFGNLCAGLLARALGLPVQAFIAATNANTTVPDYLETGDYRPRPSVPTLSNAMDVGAPNNWERIENLFQGDLEALRRVLRWGSQSDEETERSIRDLHAHGYLADPHAAVAWGVLRARLQPGETGVFLGTAHPAKFLPVYERLGIEVAIPPALSDLLGRPLLGREIPNEVGALREVLEEGFSR